MRSIGRSADPDPCALKTFVRFVKFVFKKSRVLKNYS